MEITVAVQHCQRCAHDWFPRSLQVPVTCPKCKSPYWKMPYKRKRTQKAALKARA